MKSFKIKWTHIATGRKHIGSYIFDGLGIQKGHSFGSWIHECIMHGMKNGFRHDLSLLAEQYPNMTRQELRRVIQS